MVQDLIGSTLKKGEIFHVVTDVSNEITERVRTGIQQADMKGRKITIPVMITYDE